MVVDGPQTRELEIAISSAPSFDFRVVRQPARLGLVANWNECLQLGSHDLVHVMHADDAVAPAFHSVVRAAMTDRRVTVVAAGRLPPVPRTPMSRRLGSPAPVTVMHGSEAVRYLLSHFKPAAGSFVLRRSALGTPPRGFDPRFRHCPDEELFLRVAGTGSLGIVDDRLYLESQHDRQARYSTWRRPDFADVYFAARIEGSGTVDGTVVHVARRQTSRRLLSVGRLLCKAGDRRAARAIARSIAVHDGGSLLDWRYWALLVLATASRDRRQRAADSAAPRVASSGRDA